MHRLKHLRFYLGTTQGKVTTLLVCLSICFVLLVKMRRPVCEVVNYTKRSVMEKMAEPGHDASSISVALALAISTRYSCSLLTVT